MEEEPIRVVPRVVLDEALEALATLARALVNARAAVSKPFLEDSEFDLILAEIDAALDLPAVRDVLTTDRAASHSHAARVSGEGEE